MSKRKFAFHRMSNTLRPQRDSFPKVSNQVSSSAAPGQMSHVRIKYSSRFRIAVQTLYCNIYKTGANGRKCELLEVVQVSTKLVKGLQFIITVST